MSKDLHNSCLLHATVGVLTALLTYATAVLMKLSNPSTLLPLRIVWANSEAESGSPLKLYFVAASKSLPFSKSLQAACK